MARVTFSTNDPVVWTIRDEKTTIEYFGEDYLEDYGKDIPDELLEKYEKAYQEFWRVQLLLDKFK